MRAVARHRVQRALTTRCLAHSVHAFPSYQPHSPSNGPKVAMEDFQCRS